MWEITGKSLKLWTIYLYSIYIFIITFSLTYTATRESLMCDSGEEECVCIPRLRKNRGNNCVNSSDLVRFIILFYK